MSARLVVAVALVVATAAEAAAHDRATAKALVLRSTPPWLSLRITYAEADSASLRALVGFDPGPGRAARATPAQAARLEALIVERATFALRVWVDGVPAPLDLASPAASGTTRGDRRLGVAIHAVIGWPVFCGWHHVTLRDRTPRGGPIRLRWPDGAETRLSGRDGEAARWLWICARDATTGGVGGPAGGLAAGG